MSFIEQMYRTRCNIWVNRMENQCFGKTGVGWQDGIL